MRDFKAAAEATLAIAADPRHLGARIGITAVLHSWGSAMTHHPHVHMIVPGGGLSHDGERWIACRPTFFLPVRVLSRLFRRLFLQMLAAAHKANRLAFFGDHAALAETLERFPAKWIPVRVKTELEQPRVLPKPCPCCGGRMIIIETFARGCQPKHRPTPAPPIIRIDTS
jgi:hypothetical protein